MAAGQALAGEPRRCPDSLPRRTSEAPLTRHLDCWPRMTATTPMALAGICVNRLRRTPADGSWRAAHGLTWTRTWVVMAVLAATGVHAQDLEPRLYANTPVGMNFLIAGYAYSSGGVATDLALPVIVLDGTPCPLD